ncbi:unnamed protein product [Parajaminaea phylloscopi]
MVKTAFYAALALATVGMAAASPIERDAPEPALYEMQGRLQVVGVGANNKSFNQSATFDNGAKLALGTASATLRMVFVSHTPNWTHAQGYLAASGVSCVTANKATGPTSFILDSCPGSLASNDKRDPEELKKRQLFQFTKGGSQINVVLGDDKAGVPFRPNVRIVGGNEVHTTPENNDHNMQLYLNPFSGYRKQ